MLVYHPLCECISCNSFKYLGQNLVSSDLYLPCFSLFSVGFQLLSPFAEKGCLCRNQKALQAMAEVVGGVVEEVGVEGVELERSVP
jgi:hypothetical protein